MSELTQPNGTNGEETPASILRFWFGDDPWRAASDPACARLWWAKQPTVDAQMRERFGPWVERAGSGLLDGWAQAPEGRLALILLADQFTRNIHRGTPASFALDPQALRWCLDGWEQHGFDDLAPAQRLFACMPLEHSESLEHQDRAVELTRALRDSVPPAEHSSFDGFVDFAERHREVIRRFGRFPHRNAVLGRPSTAEEVAFLQTPGSSF
jgi:uncharacterized protein (DUF924 family)